MEIWRMRPDGNSQEQVTNNNRNNWFSHISPGGKMIAFIFFLASETEAGDYTFYKHVYIRVMPTSGGEAKVIAYLYGGQDTMNTPDWSPDSRWLAFISNSDISGK